MAFIPEAAVHDVKWVMSLLVTLADDPLPLENATESALHPEPPLRARSALSSPTIDVQQTNFMAVRVYVLLVRLCLTRPYRGKASTNAPDVMTSELSSLSTDRTTVTPKFIQNNQINVSTMTERLRIPQNPPNIQIDSSSSPGSYVHS